MTKTKTQMARLQRPSKHYHPAHAHHHDAHKA
jgi:hypothetical protein